MIFSFEKPAGVAMSVRTCTDDVIFCRPTLRTSRLHQTVIAMQVLLAVIRGSKAGMTKYCELSSECYLPTYSVETGR